MSHWKPLGLVAALVLIIAAAIPGSLSAQWGMPSVIELESKLDPASAPRGAEVTLSVTVDIDFEYHIYAMDPLGEGPIATSIELTEESQAFFIPQGQWKEPAPKVKYDKGFETDIAAHYGKPTFTRTYRINPDIEPGTYTIAGALTYQACTETGCLPPTDEEFTIQLVVEEGDVVGPAIAEVPKDAQPEDAASATDQATEQPAVVEEESLEDTLAQSSFLGFLLLSFTFGLLALLTPCVFPMIPITVSFFSNKAAKSHWQAARMAGVYVLSIILGFAVIGFGASVILRLLGAGEEQSGFAQMIAANPWINLGFAALYIVLALGLFEIIHFQLPPSIANKLNRQAGARTDVAGIALKAMVFVIISFTCTAPLLGLLIVEALQGAWLRPFFGMMAFATGFSLPFFFLALAPQMMSSLPRAGSWMFSVKVVMGLLVIAAAFKFISNADLVWLGENMILSRELLLSIWAALAAVTGFYLFGVIRLQDEDGRIGLGRLMLGTVFAASALYLTAGLLGQPLHTKIEAYLPPDVGGSTMVASASGGGLPESRLATGGTKVSSGFSWFEDHEEALAHARKIGKPVFVDFTGWSCTNCREMEKLMFPDPRVAALLENYVRAKLYTDDSDKAKAKARQKFQVETFGTIALPTYGLLTPKGEVIASESYTTDKDRFVRFLEKGLDTKKVASAR